MKLLLSNIGRLVRSRRFIAVAVLCAVCVGGLWWYSDSAKQQFERAYTKYQVVAAVQQNAAFVPGAATNSVRDSLNQTLARLLDKGTKPAERMVLTVQGLQMIDQLNKEVDAIGDSVPAVTSAIAVMRSSADNSGNVLRRGTILNIVALAQKQMSTIEDIRGLSYRADFEVAQICNHLASEKGVLTDQYTIELNNSLPDTEKEFNKRENAYADLQSNMYDIQKSHRLISGN